MIIETFVFFDINSVGYDIKTKKGIKIMELTLIAVSRKDIIKADGKISPPLGKLSLLFNPEKNISTKIANSLGLSNDFLINQPVFKNKINTINSFLELRKPVCLVALSGNKFDYKVLRSEYVAATAVLPDDLLCFDPSSFFKETEKQRKANLASANNSLLESSNASFNTSGDQPGPSSADDSLNAAMAALTTAATPEREKTKPIPKIYESIMNREPPNSQRTEVRARMLLDCAIATKHTFLPSADENSKLINTIEPFPNE